MSHLLRTSRTQHEIAVEFGKFLKAKGVKARGMVKVGRTNRNNGMRGLIATKDIPMDEICVLCPVTASISAATPFHDPDFMSMFNNLKAEERNTLLCHAKTAEEFFNARVAVNSMLLLNQLLIGYYMVHVMLSGNYEQHSGFLSYIDAMPRDEGNFNQLTMLLSKMLDASEENMIGERVLAQRHHLSITDVRAVLLWALCMIFSRAAPMDHVPTIQKMFAGTPFGDGIGEQALNIPALCPLIDICNHSANENAAMFVTESADGTPMESRVVCLRTVKPIKAGEEVVMTYAVPSHAHLEMFYGMQPVAP